MTTSLRFDPLPARTAPSDATVWVDDGGAPLRCCLRDSRTGERIALLAVTPVGPSGAYRETGPVLVHAEACAGPATDDYPVDWRARAQVLRAYDPAGEIAGGEVVPAGADIEAAAGRLLADPGIAFLQTRNVVHGCYMLTIRRA
ncbi:MAG: DUF1203 domain-containing protein [Geodermatophilaceae bacterium]|nr:DUF1203 domain-containing protein [Geodermatophilaceae bacterium]